LPAGVCSGERSVQQQLELLELEPGVSTVEVQAESERPSVQPSTKTRRQHPGRQELPANLPRVERILKCTPEQCVCKGCGKETVVIGHEEGSQLDVEPAKSFVLVSKREKRACKSCEEIFRHFCQVEILLRHPGRVRTVTCADSTRRLSIYKVWR
jgi:transposase